MWRRTRLAAIAGAALLFWLLSAGWLTAVLLDLAQPAIYRTPYDLAHAPRDAFSKRTVLVVLGGGTEYRDDGTLVPRDDALVRLSTAAALHARCEAAGASCRVLICGGNPEHHAASEADTYLPWLLRAGVPRDAIVLENQSLTTWQNARNAARILQDDDDASLMLITSSYQMRRAMLDFDRFGYAPTPVVANVRRAHPGWMPRLGNLVSAETALHELIGTAQFYVYSMIGWFDPRNGVTDTRH